MNSKLSNKCISALACFGILTLLAILAVVWIQFFAGSFRNASVSRVGSEEREYRSLNRSASSQAVQSRSQTRLKEFREISYLGNLDSDNDIEYIKPMKIIELPLHVHDIIFNEMNNYSNPPDYLHHSGHFRHRLTEIWDPHPNYDIAAFGKKLRLQLALDNSFISPNLYLSHTWNNYTHRLPDDKGMMECFYTGNVEGDADSEVVVSLCNGMTGYIRTSEGIYYIEPAEIVNGTKDSFLHRIKKVLHSSSQNNEVTPPDEVPSMCGTNDFEHDFNNEIREEEPTALQLQNTVNNYSNVNTAIVSSTNNSHTSNRSRKKREIDDYDFEEEGPLEYFVEVMVVAHRSMLEFYTTREEMDHYIRILMSQAARLFKHPSIGNAITLSVVEIRILEEDIFGDYNGTQDILNRFCSWKKKHTVHEDHDVALLLTRQEFCQKQTSDCTTLGFAIPGTMCSECSCAVVTDKGLSSTYTIAHEIGHLLNMPHDNNPECVKRNVIKDYIMTYKMVGNINFWMWSACSRHFATEFLGTNKSKCLFKPPTINVISTDLTAISPGEKYKINQQCEFAFGKGAMHCDYVTEQPCSLLWCKKDQFSECLTMHQPLAEGTACGRDRWCHNGNCMAVKENDFRPIVGGWGLWSEWGECSRSCGGGVKSSHRQCDSPVPENGGDYCLGQSLRYASCNTQPCPDDIDFRTVQCSEFDGKPFNNDATFKKVRWLPKYGLGGEDRCKLYCRVQHASAYLKLKSKVVDGTKCGLNSFGICVNGKCRSGGCDNRLHSKKKLDDCGVCGGNNSQCLEIYGVYNDTSPSAGYNTILKFPKGSSSISITQKDRSGEKLQSYLVLADGETGKYILNGNNVLAEKQKDITFGGLKLNYSGSKALIERITTNKNEILTKPLILLILTIDSHTSRPDVTYSYYISKENAPSNLSSDMHVRYLKSPTVPTIRYSWRVYQKEWSDCSSVCSGFQFMKALCVELGPNEQVVNDYYCAGLDNDEVVHKKECNNHCRLIWMPVKREQCSVECGKGVRNVKYMCKKIDNGREKYEFLQIVSAEVYGEIVDDSYCSSLPSPQYTEPCMGRCNYNWQYSDWSQCSKTCGSGVQVRRAKCIDNDNKSDVVDDRCKNLNKITERECKINECPQWVTSEWGQCSAKCGRGYKRRNVSCKVGENYYKEHFCDQHSKPTETMECMEKYCVHWETGQWSACSASCGQGVQTREVFCESKDLRKVVELIECEASLKPNATRICQMKRCLPVSSIIKTRYPYIEQHIKISNHIDYIGDQWITGPWSQCSKTCEGGYSFRKVYCVGEHRGHYCDKRKKPIARINCNTFRCPKWQLGGWSECDQRCEKHRLVACQNDTGSIMADHYCNLDDRPSETAKCKLSQCNELNNTNSRQYFNWTDDDSGRYRWKIGRWKECSAKCGAGLKTRNITCHKVYPGGLIDPNPMPDLRYNRHRRNYCDMYKRPKERMPCKESSCDDKFVWKPGPWRECSQRCGRKGRQTRQLYCYTSSGAKVAKRYCPRGLRPKRKRKCNQWQCAHKSCADVKYNLRTRENKDYLLNLNGKYAVVYCFKMDTREPEEYISLMSDTHNFAEIYAKRLKDTNSCPYNGERNDNCDCLDIGPERSGVTQFYKVRLDISSMRIIGEDSTFSSQSWGKTVPYGTAGDCYSQAERCGQGRFSVDLSGTSFKLASDVSWVGNITRVHKTDRIASGICGGFCGECRPDYNVGLHVEVT